MKNIFKHVVISSTIIVGLSFFSFSSAREKEKFYTIEQLPVLAQEAQHKEVTKRVVSRFTRVHYRDIILNDAFSEQILNRYLDMLDYGKYLFLQSEIEQIKANYKNKLVAELKSGELKSAYELFNLSLKKRFAYYQYSLSLLKIPMDFTSNDQINLDFDNVSWAKTKVELDKRWYKRVKADRLGLLLTKKSESETKNLLTKRYRAVLNRLTQTNSEDVFQTFMNAFARSIDPHTSYLAPKTKKQFNSEINLSLEGIGAVLKIEDEYPVIVSMVSGGPAAKSKELAVGDKIIGVGQEKGEIEDVIGWRLDDTVELIRGVQGSIVRLQIEPVGQKGQTKIVTIKREKIRLEDRAVKSSIVEIKGKKVAILTVPSFYVGLTENAKTILENLKKQSIEGIVVDLRGNGGGSLSEAIGLSGLFISEGPIVQVKDTRKRVNRYDDNDGITYYEGPVVVMVDRYSASASEIFAAVLQDYGRALIVGETTFGKGTVQTHQPLAHVYDSLLHPEWPELGAVQYTIQKFYRINGGSTQLEGVIPDIKLPYQTIIDKYGERYEDNALPWDSVEKAPYVPLSDVKPFITKLRQLHDARIKKDPEFQYILDDIAYFDSKKESRYILSLNFDIRDKESKERDKKLLDRANVRLSKKGLPPVKELPKKLDNEDEVDPYRDEAAAILLDWKQLKAVSNTKFK